MPRRLLARWRAADAGRDEQLAPALATLGAVLAAGVLTWVLAGLCWRVLGPAPLAAPAPADPPIAKRLAAIIARRPFGVAAAADAPGAPGAASTSWRLLATLASADGQGMALLQRDGDEAQLVQPGTVLPTGERVDAITRDAVAMSGGSGPRRIELAVPADAPTTPAGAATASRQADGAPPPPGNIVNVRQPPAAYANNATPNL
jgi:hypothetical protein